MDMKPYFVDDSFPDLSRFDGMSKEELDAEIERLEKEEQEKKAKNKKLVAAI